LPNPEALWRTYDAVCDGDSSSIETQRSHLALLGMPRLKKSL